MTSTQPMPARTLLRRAFDAYRVNSSPAAVALLVLFNLVLIVGKTALDLAFHLRQHQPGTAVPVGNA